MGVTLFWFRLGKTPNFTFLRSYLKFNQMHFFVYHSEILSNKTLWIFIFNHKVTIFIFRIRMKRTFVKIPWFLKRSLVHLTHSTPLVGVNNSEAGKIWAKSNRKSLLKNAKALYALFEKWILINYDLFSSADKNNDDHFQFHKR